MRHSKPSVLVRAVGDAMARDITVVSHAHSWDQLTFAASGALQVETTAGNWLAGRDCAVWVPSGVEHAERLYAGVRFQMLCLRQGLSKTLPRSCHAVPVSPFLRELIGRIGSIGVLERSVPQHARLAQVLVDEVHALDETPMRLPSPRDPRALRLSRLVDEMPSDRASITDLARRAGASRRTLERIFLAETGMSVGEWRQRRRLLHAARLLGSERSVAAVAGACGYSNVSAFIAAFRKCFGVTPNRYRPAGSLGS